MYIHRLIIILIFLLSLSACNGFFEKDNTPHPAPLVGFNPEAKPIRLWTVRAGAGVNDDYLKMGFSINDHVILTTSSKGFVTSIDKTQGSQIWQIYTGFPITTAPGVGEGLVVVGGRRGEILAVEQNTGKIRWKNSLPSQSFAKPNIKQNIVVIKSIDGFIRALSAKNGKILWSFQQVEPNLILRSASNPLISGQTIIAGFANGNLASLNLYEGQLNWTQSIAIPEGAFAIQRMIDIDADPVLFEHHLYAATYQGKISSLDWSSGKIVWSHDISSYTGMAADSNTIFITDAKSHVWAFDASSGLVIWRQNKLQARVLTAPTLQGNYVVVGDAQGYLHWLSKRDGHIVARERVGAMFAPPIEQNGIVYALTNSGYLSAFTL